MWLIKIIVVPVLVGFELLGLVIAANKLSGWITKRIVDTRFSGLLAISSLATIIIIAIGGFHSRSMLLDSKGFILWIVIFPLLFAASFGFTLGVIREWQKMRQKELCVLYSWQPTPDVKALDADKKTAFLSGRLSPVSELLALELTSRLPPFGTHQIRVLRRSGQVAVFSHNHAALRSLQETVTIERRTFVRGGLFDPYQDNTHPTLAELDSTDKILVVGTTSEYRGDDQSKGLPSS